MALEGTLKDFGLADIFQLIGIQKKTGILSLKDGRETVTVLFQDGEVVAADSSRKNLEDRLGNVLVKSGRITDLHLQKALVIQKETRQRIGDVVVQHKYMTEAELREALGLQITQIVYRLFRWKAGDYHFAQKKEVEYDRDHFSPISAESILMEGIRMIDEWPIIERRIKSFDMVFRKANPDARPVIADVRTREESDLEAALREPESAPESAASGGVQAMFPEEAALYDLVNGERSVQELIDRSRYGEFDTCRILHELLTRNLIVGASAGAAAVASTTPGMKARIGPFLERAGYAGLFLVATLSLLTSRLGPLSGSPRMLIPAESQDRVEQLVTRNRIERLDEAVNVYFLQKGFLPDDLRDLVKGGLIAPSGLTDADGRLFGFVVTTGGYRIIAYDDGGVENTGRSLARSLSGPAEDSATNIPDAALPEAHLRTNSPSPSN